MYFDIKKTLEGTIQVLGYCFFFRHDLEKKSAYAYKAGVTFKLMLFVPVETTIRKSD